MGLGVYYHWVAHIAKIIDRHITNKVYLTGSAINLYLSDMCAKGKIKVRRIEICHRFKTRSHTGRQIPGKPQSHGDLLKCLDSVGLIFGVHFAALVNDVLYRHLEYMSSQTTRLFFNLLSSLIDSSPFDTVGTASIASLSKNRAICVRVNDPDPVKGKAEFLCNNLRQCCFLRLTMRLCTCSYCHFAIWVNFYMSTCPCTANKSFHQSHVR